MYVEDRDALATTPARETALACVAAGVGAADPERVVREAVAADGDRLTVTGGTGSPDVTTEDLAAYDEVLVVGAGKPAGRVAAALESVFGDRLDGGAVVTESAAGADADTAVDERAVEGNEDGAVDEAASRADVDTAVAETASRTDADAVVDAAASGTDAVEIHEGDHPLPGEDSVAATRRVLDCASGAGAGTLVLGAVGGGGSALLAAPAAGVPLADLRATTRALLRSGATIHEVNAVRKHLSAVKGGGLARAAAPARVVALVFSDVVGDDLDVVASGPFAPDGSTFADALAVLDRHGIEVPSPVRERLESGAAGDRPETPGPGARCFDRVSHHVLADATTALSGARAAARDRGYEPLVLSSRVAGEARAAAPTHVAVAAEVRATGTPVDPPAVVLSGGETTVTVTGDGTGGPNQEFALAAALCLDGTVWSGGRDVAIAAVDTDGRDGGTDAAGALVDGATVDGASVEDAARAALADNDAYPFLESRDALVRTGPTGTNVNDLRVLVVE